MKRAIALLYTILFTISILVLVSEILNIYNKISSVNTPKVIAQNSIILKDLNDTLYSFLKDVNSSKELNLIFNSFALSNKDGNFRIFIKISPYSNKINLNLYAVKKYHEAIDEVLSKLLDEYQINDPLFFKDLILDTIDEDKKEREGDSEIVLYNANFLNGAIYNFAHFKQILDFYAKRRDDKKIYDIPWKKVFYFSSKEYIIPCEFMSKELKSLLDIDNEESCKTLFEDEGYKKLFNSLNIKLYKKNEDFLVKVEINYFLDNIESNFSIIYNLKNYKKVLIESYPIY